MFGRSQPSEPEQVINSGVPRGTPDEEPESVPTPARQAKVLEPSTFASRRRPEEPRGRRMVHLGTQQIRLPAAGRSQRNQVAEVDVWFDADHPAQMFAGYPGDPTLQPVAQRTYDAEKVEQLGAIRVNPGMPSTTFAPGEPDRVRPA